MEWLLCVFLFSGDSSTVLAAGRIAKRVHVSVGRERVGRQRGLSLCISGTVDSLYTVQGLDEEPTQPEGPGVYPPLCLEHPQ